MKVEMPPVIDHDREWIIGCIKHDGFIKTDRFDKANQIILDALELADRPTEDYSDLPDIPRAYYEKIVGNMSHEINMLKQQLEDRPSVSAEPTSDDLIIKNGKGIQDGLYNIKDGEIFKYKAKGGTVRIYELVSADMLHHIENNAEVNDLVFRPSADRLTVTKDEMEKLLIKPSGEWKHEYRKTANGIDFCVISCSECDYYDAQMHYYNYCPSCGAIMKGGDDE